MKVLKVNRERSKSEPQNTLDVVYQQQDDDSFAFSSNQPQNSVNKDKIIQ